MTKTLPARKVPAEVPTGSCEDGRQPEPAPERVKLAVIGAGPHALALVSRLLEPRAFGKELVDTGEAEAHGLSRRRVRDAEAAARRAGARRRRERMRGEIAVVDPSGRWLAGWESAFKGLGIRHLRSPSDQHVGPLDPFELVHTAHRGGGIGLVELRGVKRDRHFKGPFHVPTSDAFLRHARATAHRYGLDDAVRADRAESIEPAAPAAAKGGGDSCRPRVLVRLASGRSLLADRVVVAVGHCNSPRVPRWCVDCGPVPRVWHAWDLVRRGTGDAVPLFLRLAAGSGEGPEPAPAVVAVVGGGLTAAHAVREICGAGVPCHQLCRSPVRRQAFDVPVEWAGVARGARLREYLQEECPAAREEQLQQWRGRASVPPRELEALEQLDGLVRHEGVEVESAWAEDEGGLLTLRLTDGDVLEGVGGVLLCTGSTGDCREEPLFRGLRERGAPCTEAGRPVLNDDTLEWNGTGVHLLGAHAALSLGPDALNLAGARRGAFRAAGALGHLFE